MQNRLEYLRLKTSDYEERIESNTKLENIESNYLCLFHAYEINPLMWGR